MKNSVKISNGISYVEAYESPMLERNIDKYGHDGCYCCGKPMKNEDLHIHLSTSGYFVANDTPEDFNDEVVGESQGCFPIGKACAKKLPSNFVIDFSKKREAVQQVEEPVAAPVEESKEEKIQKIADGLKYSIKQVNGVDFMNIKVPFESRLSDFNNELSTAFITAGFVVSKMHDFFQVHGRRSSEGVEFLKKEVATAIFMVEGHADGSVHPEEVYAWKDSYQLTESKEDSVEAEAFKNYIKTIDADIEELKLERNFVQVYLMKAYKSVQIELKLRKTMMAKGQGTFDEQADLYEKAKHSERTILNLLEDYDNGYMTSSASQSLMMKETVKLLNS